MRKYAFVTGGASGIGLSIVKKFIRSKYMVFVVDHSETNLKKAYLELHESKNNFELINFDITSWSKSPDIFARIKARKTDHVVLVNNAGRKENMDLLSETENSWDDQISVFLKAPFRLSQSFIDFGIAEEFSGSICNVGSIVSNYVSLQSPAYHVSKAGIAGLTKYLAVTAARLNAKITVNAIEPGLIIQQRHQDIYTSENNEAYRKLTEYYQPAGVPGSEVDISESIYWMTKKNNSYINGEILRIDGAASLQEHHSLLMQYSSKINK